jgi:hypothetical protein
METAETWGAHLTFGRTRRMQRSQSLVIASWIAVAGVVALAADSKPARLTLEDLVEAQGVQAPSLSPDGKWFALPWQGQIVLASSEGGWPVPLTSTTGAKTGLDWSADGRALAFASGGAIWTVPSGGG